MPCSTRCWWRSGAAPTASRSAPTPPGCLLTSAGSSRSTSSSAPTSRTSSPSATSSANPCSPTRPPTKARSPPRTAPDTLLLRRHRHPRWPTPTPRCLGRGHRERSQSRRGQIRQRRVPLDWHRAAPCPSAATKASPKSCSTSTTDRIIGAGIVGPSSRRPHRRSRAGHRDRRRRRRHRAHHPPAPDPVGDRGHGRRGLRRHHHRPLHAQEEEVTGSPQMPEEPTNWSRPPTATSHGSTLAARLCSPPPPSTAAPRSLTRNAASWG